MKSQSEKIMLAILRVFLGWQFLWGFVDKFLGLGFSTCRIKETGAIEFLCDSAWIKGGSATFGFLKFGTYGPLTNFYQNIAGVPFVEWLFMSGLLFIGLAMVLGIGMRLAGFFGAVFMVLMYSATILPEHNPLIDDHIIYATMAIYFIFTNAGNYYGLGEYWQNTKLVKKFPLLK